MTNVNPIDRTNWKQISVCVCVIIYKTIAIGVFNNRNKFDS